MAQARTNPWLVLVVLTSGFFMILLDTTIVNVAIPAMSAGLNTTLDQILWVLNAYILVYAVLLITAGRLGDLYGQRNLFAIGLFVFTAASALCGISQNANELIAARILQGVGGAFLTPQTLSIITTLFPPERRGAAVGVWGGVAGLETIPEVIIDGVVIVVLFLFWERFQKEPLLPLSLFRERNFAVANWISAAISFGMLSLFLPVTIYLQSVRGFSALTAGLTFAPMSLTSMLVAPFAGRLADKIGGKYILLTGISLFTVGFGLVTFVAGPDSTWLTFLGPAIIAGAGMGMTFAPMTTVAMRNISPQMAGAASGVLNTTRQLGAAIGSAVVGALLQNHLASTLHNQAVSYASSLPPSFRDQFVAAFSSVSSNGFEIGAGQSGAKLPQNIPPAVAHQIAALAHDVFVSAYIDAMKATLVVPIAFLAFTALTTLLIKRRKRPGAEQALPVEEEQLAAAAGLAKAGGR